MLFTVNRDDYAGTMVLIACSRTINGSEPLGRPKSLLTIANTIENGSAFDGNPNNSLTTLSKREKILRFALLVRVNSSNCCICLGVKSTSSILKELAQIAALWAVLPSVASGGAARQV